MNSLGIAGLNYNQYKDGAVHRVMFPKQITQNPSTHSYEFRFAVGDIHSAKVVYYVIELTESLYEETNEFQQCVIASRKLYELLGTTTFNGSAATGDASRLLAEDKRSSDFLRYSIAEYALNRFERKFEERFLLWEFIAAIEGNAGKVFRQLQYFHMHSILLFNPPLERIAPKPKLQDLLTLEIELEVSSKAELIDIVEKADKDKNQESFEKLVKMTEEILGPVFIVHGRNEEIANSIKSYVESLGIRAIVLREQPNKGLTIIEKLEHNSAVGFAIVIMSADDEGRLKGEKELNSRARQNVILELGYFMGKLGRGKVASILPEPVNFEKPSDIDGLLYIPFDDADYWKSAIKKELLAAGYNDETFSIRKTLF